ncbi:Uncharacterised protein [Klebsiella pneumoniae]|nr:Uncharacterised protein [Klebsiella pneumoniae]SAR99944.1 Uncharacterised protein [Klebsiella pneumoniae]
MLQCNVKHGGDHEEDNHRHRPLAYRRKAVGEEADRVALSVILRQTARRNHHPEGGDKRRDTGPRHQETVSQAAQQADADPRANGDHRRQVDQRREHWRQAIGGLRQAGRHHRRKGNNRAGGEVNPGGDDHLGDADGDDADNRHLQHNQHQPVGIEQERLVANIPAGDFKGQGNHQHHHKDAGIFRHFMPQISEEGGTLAGRSRR